MNSMERLIAFINGHWHDRVPCIPLVFGYASKVFDIPLHEYLKSGEILTQCQLQCQKDFGYDGVFVYFDSLVEAEALGCQIKYSPNSYPYIVKRLEEDWHQSLSPIPDPQKDGRMPELLKAAANMRSAVGDSVPVIGVVLGPISIAGQLLGLDKLLYMLIDYPYAFKRILDYTSDITLRFAKSFLKAGIHIPMVFDPIASQSIIPPEVFVEKILPNLKGIFSELKGAGALVSWLAITGRTQEILPYYQDCCIDVATIDYEVSMETVLSTAPRIVIAGNIKPYSLVNMKPIEVFAEGKKLLELVGNTKSKGLILSTGCEVPLDTSKENLKALIEVTRGGVDEE